MTLPFRASYRPPARPFLLTFATSLETSTKAQPPEQAQPEQVRSWPHLQPHPALRLTEALSPLGSPGGKLPPEGGADNAAAGERPAGRHLWPGESHGPAGAGGNFREGQRLTAQPTSAEKEQTAGEPRWRPSAVDPALQEGQPCILTPALPLATTWPWTYRFVPHALRPLIYHLGRIMARSFSPVGLPPLPPNSLLHRSSRTVFCKELGTVR